MNTQISTTATHTPGPWQIGHLGSDKDSTIRYNASNVYDSCGEKTICSVSGIYLHCCLSDLERDDNGRCAEGLANARLIAAAPELLASLKQAEDELSGVLEQLEDRFDGAPDSVQKWMVFPITEIRRRLVSIRPAIAKAEGRA